MSFDTAPDLVRNAVAGEAGRSCPGGMAFVALDREMAAFIRDLVLKGKITDHPHGPQRPPLEPA